MSTSRVAKRYANGLLEYSQEQGETKTVFEEMKTLVETLDNSKELRAFFASPFLDSQKKMQVAQEVFASLSVTGKNFISLVIRQGRETILKNIAQQFIAHVEAMHGVQKVSLTTAGELSKETITHILKASNLVDADKTFDIETRIKPEILGGYILRVGDKQIDASVKTELARIKKEFQYN